MILIADGGSTKADWVALDAQGTELFRTRTHGINPEILTEDVIVERVEDNSQLQQIKNEVIHVYFYGAGCGTDRAKVFLKETLSRFFGKAKVYTAEDMLAAVYAASGGKESIVCILGTGSNSCYWDGQNMHQICPSLGYLIMDEASANLFGRRLLRDYFYKRMPEDIYNDFTSRFEVDADVIKDNMYKKDTPNAFLGEYARIMFDHKKSDYIRKLLEEGFREFYDYRVLNFDKAKEVPVYFIGSIAYYFQDILEYVGKELGIQFAGAIQRPIDNLIKYHQSVL